MDVELQSLKHLARDAQPTVSFIDEYCRGYKDLFPEVRSYECFKYLHIGIISPLKRKSLPEIAKVTGINSAQSLHHFLAQSPWSVIEIRERRLSKTLQALKGKKITVILDETGDRKKGKKTDYVARQYLGSIGKIDNGIVSVNAYGVYEHLTFPLILKIFKPKGTLKPNEQYKTKIEGKSNQIQKILGNLYGLRTWVEYGFRQCKQESCWTDYRLTKFEQIEKWWEIIMSAYLMVSLNSQVFEDLNQSSLPSDDKQS